MSSVRGTHRRTTATVAPPRARAPLIVQLTTPTRGVARPVSLRGEGSAKPAGTAERILATMQAERAR